MPFKLHRSERDTSDKDDTITTSTEGRKKSEEQWMMQIITVKELSDLLKVKEKTLYQWSELGQVPCFKLNGSLRFDLEDIQKWICDCKKRPETGYNPLTRLEARKGGRNY